MKNALGKNGAICVWVQLRDCQHLGWGVGHCLLNEAKFVPKRPSPSPILDMMRQVHDLNNGFDAACDGVAAGIKLSDHSSLL